jgi:hypothetical protein
MLPHIPLVEQNAMNRFVQRFTSSIVAVLGCHDRVIFHGHLPFGGDEHLNRYVDYGLKIRRKDFLPFVEKHSQVLVDHAQTLAQKSGVPYQFLQGKQDKEAIARKRLRQVPHDDGLVVVLCCMETCRAVKLLSGKQRPRLAFRQRPQRVLYYYYLDAEFGLIHVRLQTFFPFTCQVYVNGHDWLARQMQQRRLGFVQTDNAFTQLDDPAQAQELADRFSQLDWVAILDRWIRPVQPLLGRVWLEQRAYRWVINQAEFSTDLLFRSSQSLKDLYRQLVDHATLNFSAEDILSFLGRRLHPRFDGEVLTDCKKGRQPGVRVKHRVKNNWLKMYDKFGQILRIETVINQPREFKVRRRRERQGKNQMVWCPMNKGVANFYHYHDVARASNERYLAALATAATPCATVQQLEQLHHPAQFKQRRRRALNVLSAAEQQLFLAVLRGDHRLNGFRNTDVARQLFPKQPPSLKERRRRTAQVSRKLQLLRAHGLIAAVPHSYRYQITPKGEELMNAAIYVRYKAFPNEMQAVA